MPVVIVYGLPEDLGENDLVFLCGRLQEAVAGVNALDLKKSDVTVFPLADRMKAGSGEKIIVVVDGLLNLPGCTDETRQYVAEAIMETMIKNIYRDGILIECSVHPLVKKEQGFCTFKT